MGFDNKPPMSVEMPFLVRPNCISRRYGSWQVPMVQQVSYIPYVFYVPFFRTRQKCYVWRASKEAVEWTIEILITFHPT